MRAAGLFLAALMLAAPEAAAENFRAGDLTIQQPWARASAGRARVGVAYLTIANGGAAPDRLLGVASPVAQRAALHVTAMEGGIMKMRAVGAVDIPPGETVTLAPGGLHIMLMRLAAPLKRGTAFPLTLTFARAGAVEVTVRVLGPGARGPGR